MIPMWLANPGEDFAIRRVKTPMTLVTAGGKELALSEMIGCHLSIVSKTADSIYGVFRGHRIAFDQVNAKAVYGDILGKTQGEVAVNAAAPCTHHCAGCSGCIH